MLRKNDEKGHICGSEGSSRSTGTANKKTAWRNLERQASVPKAAAVRIQKMRKRCIPLSLLKGQDVCHITYFRDFTVIYSVFNMQIFSEDTFYSKTSNK